MIKSSLKLPISAMVVGYNEAHFLEACLSSISFCDEIVYTDLGSTDNSIAIAQKYSSGIYHRKKVPSCEFIQTEVVHLLKNDWVIFIDPDEKIDSDLESEILIQFAQIENDSLIGAVSVPWLFYFRNILLRGTIWGGQNKKVLLVNRNRFQFLPIIHHGRVLKKGFTEKFIENPENKNAALHHYWMKNTKVFLSKHARYLLTEGETQFSLGRRVGLKELLLKPFTAFYQCFVEYKGYRDLFVGFLLSLYWAYFQTRIVIDIYKLGKRL